jgi:hypothetical protein
MRKGTGVAQVLILGGLAVAGAAWGYDVLSTTDTRPQLPYVGVIGVFAVLAGVLALGARLIRRRTARTPWTIGVLGLGLLGLAGTASAIIPPPIVITGTALDCRAGKAQAVPGLEVRVYDAESNQRLLRLLRRMDALEPATTDSRTLDRFTSSYAPALERVLSRSPTLGRGVTRSGTLTGVFAVSVRPVESVLVFVRGAATWDLFYYGYRTGAVPPDAAADFSVDMSRGRCGYPLP